MLHYCSIFVEIISHETYSFDAVNAIINHVTVLNYKEVLNDRNKYFI